MMQLRYGDFNVDNLQQLYISRKLMVAQIVRLMVFNCTYSPVRYTLVFYCKSCMSCLASSDIKQKFCLVKKSIVSSLLYTIRHVSETECSPCY